MRNNILPIIKKEFHRFFHDKRLVFTTVFLPAMLMFALYYIMGSFTTNSIMPDSNYVPQCYVENMPDSFQPIFDQLGVTVHQVDNTEEAKLAVKNQEMDLLVVFPADFDEAITEYSQGGTAPNIAVYHNSAATESAMIYQHFVTAANDFESSIVNVLDINQGMDIYDLASGSDFFSLIFGGMLPALVISILFSCSNSVAVESIAGEKERGTIATLLVTPTKRSDIAIGKLISLSCFALLGGIASFISLMFSLPTMMEGMAGPDFSMNMYGFSEYAALFALFATTILLIISLISVVSANARSVKEATALTSPLIVVSTLVSLVTMLPADFSGIGWRCIPIVNCALDLHSIFNASLSVSNILVTCISNLVFAALFTAILAKMFNSEKTMFKK